MKLKIIAGPCVMEGNDSSWIVDVAGDLYSQLRQYKDSIDFYFKVSWDKANRTSSSSYRGVPFEVALDRFRAVRYAYRDMKMMTDFHDPTQALPLATVVDMLQVPAFLCRQTDMIVAAVNTSLPINIKKGQFISPSEANAIFQKAVAAGGNYRGGSEVWITERGTFFGYNRLVVDIVGMYEMREYGIPLIFDCTHSVQLPGAKGSSSGGVKKAIPFLSHAVASTGLVGGFFFETHPRPDEALSDPATQLPLGEAGTFVEGLLEKYAGIL
jgi:2-dehydro-3-deoxyphosphooctonate aldolase (KDO 8-P synthase)